MMLYRHGIVMALLLLSAIPVGYFFAPVPTEELANQAMPWSLPKLDGKSSSSQPKPSNLARFWPVKTQIAIESKSQAGQTSTRQAADAAWTLVAVFRQGHNPTALVLGPDQRLIRLSVGMAFGDASRVIGIESDKLFWENNAGEQGHLTLYPRPAADVK